MVSKPGLLHLHDHVGGDIRREEPNQSKTLLSGFWQCAVGLLKQALVGVPHLQRSLETVHRRSRLGVHNKRQEVLAHKGLVLVDRLGDSAERLKAVVPRQIGKGALGRGASLRQAESTSGAAQSRQPL